MRKFKTTIENATQSTKKAIKKACIENAKFLLKQAEIQFKSQNFNLAIFFAITAYEESLKFSLFNPLESKLLTPQEFNEIWSSHNLKLLSKHSTVMLSVDDNKKVYSKYIIPKKSDYFNNEIKDIVKKREKSLYVDFDNTKLNVPNKMNLADAVEEINRAQRSILNELSFDHFSKQLKKKMREIKQQNSNIIINNEYIK